MVTTVYRIPAIIGYLSMPVGMAIATFYNVIYFIRGIKYFIQKKDYDDDGVSEIEEMEVSAMESEVAK
jgi:TRAP-type C4-dicarboxylate transport system permease small subunit